jgi:sugar phosphate isomerase/epimerase
MSIYLATQRPLGEIRELLQKYNTGVEIQPFCNPKNLDKPDNIMDDVLKCISGTKRKSLHAPFFGMNPSCLDYKVRDVAAERFSQAYAIGKKLNVSNMVFHTGYSFYFKPTPDMVRRFGEFWNDFLRDKEDDIEIHFENVFEQRWEYLKEFIDTIDSKKVSICLDLGHVNANSDQDIETWVKGFKDKIKYVHIHNNYGDTDSHYGLKRGTIDMYRALNLLKEYSGNAIWTVETPEIEESIKWLTDNKLYE